MARVAVLGLGAMGSRVAQRLLDAGHELSVWNRSGATPLLHRAARVDRTPREAAAGADFVVAVVADDAASRRVWLDPHDGAALGLGRETIAVESSTLSLAFTRCLGARLHGNGFAFVDAPMVGSRPQAESGALVYVAGGDDEHVRRVAAVLSPVVGTVRGVGPVGSGMALKLAVNALLGIQAAAAAELLAVLQRAGFEAAAILAGLQGLSVTSPALLALATAMATDQHAAMFPIHLMAKDMGYVLDMARTCGMDSMPASAMAAQRFGEAIAAGLGPLHVSALSRLTQG